MAFDWALGLKILTLINAFSNLLPQDPYIATSSRAPSWVLAERWDRDSPESGCKWGSVVTPWQASCSSVSNVAVISQLLTSLCLTAGKPPALHVSACSTLNGCPLLQWDGEFLRSLWIVRDEENRWQHQRSGAPGHAVIQATISVPFFYA